MGPDLVVPPRRLANWAPSVCLAALVLAGCEQSRPAPSREEAPAEAKPAALAPPFDVSSVVRSARLGFWSEGEGWITGQAAFTAKVSPRGLAFSPVHSLAPKRSGVRERRRSRKVEGAAALFTTHSIRRGDQVHTLSYTQGTVEPDGSLSLGEGNLIERLAATEGGLEQSWRFAEAPSGKGDLTVRIRVTGQRYSGRTQKGLHFVDPSSGLGVCYGPATWVDASGARSPVDARWSGTDLVLKVPSEILNRSRYPAVLDPFVSAEFGLDTPVVGSVPGEQVEPSGAFDGTNWLVVWSDQRRGPEFDLFGARVRPDGTLVDPAGFAITNSPGSEYSPDVAFDGSNYLVVWSDDRGAASGLDIYGTRITPAGVVTNPTGFTVTTAAGDQDYPSLAFDGTSYLAVWEDGRNGATNFDIYGTRLSTAGGSLTPGVGAISSASGNQLQPAVAAGGGSFFVIWEDYRNGASNADIFGAALNPAGVLLDPNGLGVCTTTGHQLSPELAFGTDTFLMVWEDYRAGPESDLYAGRFDPNIGVLEFNGMLFSSANGHQASPSVEFDGSNFLVVWEDLRTGTTTEVYGQRVAPSIAFAGTEFIVSSAADDQLLPRPLAAPGTGGWLVVWNDLRNLANAETDIWGTRITAGGAVQEPAGVQISRSASAERSPAVAFDGTNYLVVWEGSRTPTPTGIDLYGIRVNSSGVPVGTSVITVSAATGDQQLPAVAFNGTEYLVVWQDARNATFDIYGTRVSKAGAVASSSGLIISSAVNDQHTPAVAAGGASWLVVWQDCRLDATCQTNPNIMAARVNASGAVVDSAGVAVEATSAPALFPAVAYDGTNYLVAWTDGRNQATTGWDVYATLVDASGAALQPSGIALTTAAGTQRNPSLAFGAGNYLVAWSDCRDDLPCLLNANLYGTRVSPAGSVLDASGLTLSTAAGNQLFPKVAYDGFNFVLAWEDGRTFSSTAMDLYWARVSGGGALLDATGLVIANSPTGEETPALASGGGGITLAAYDYFDHDAGVQSVRVRGRFIYELPKGQPCTVPAQCQSGFCVSGVCCESACNTGLCQSCAQATGAPADGTCATAAANTVCRAAAGACDVEERCNGSTTACPANALRASGQVCRPSAGACDLDESCLGNDPNCPSDLFRPATATCRAASGLCDEVETCSGNDAGCPLDALRPAGRSCRPVIGPCDFDEVCTGNDAGCPPDVLRPSSEVCRATSGPCDQAERCSGVDAGCPADLLRPSGEVCRPSAGACDLAESCSGVDAGCPGDLFRPSSAVCRPMMGECDVSESCTGAGPACPNDTFKPATQLCRVLTDICDRDESCTGSAASCPADLKAEDGIACDLGMVCSAGLCKVRPDAGPDGGADGGLGDGGAADGGRDAGRSDGGTRQLPYVGWSCGCSSSGGPGGGGIAVLLLAMTRLRRRSGGRR